MTRALNPREKKITAEQFSQRQIFTFAFLSLVLYRYLRWVSPSFWSITLKVDWIMRRLLSKEWNYREDG